MAAMTTEPAGPHRRMANAQGHHVDLYLTHAQGHHVDLYLIHLACHLAVVVHDGPD